MVDIKAKVVGHALTLVQSPQAAAGSVQADRVQFTFDEAWDGLYKVALFWGAGSDEPYASVVDGSGYAEIPWEVLEERSKIKFGVYGTEPGETTPRITSTLIKYAVQEGAWSDSIANPGDPTPTLIEQFTAAAEAEIDHAMEVAGTMEERLASYGGTLPGDEYERTLANVAGTQNIICNIRGSQWDDIPFGGALVNAQYAQGYDIQVIYKIEGNAMAYRFVDRSTHEPYMDWCVTDTEAMTGQYIPEPVALSYTEGGYIDSATGAVVSYDGWKYTGYIDISGTDAQRVIVSTTASGSTVYNAFYDADQAYICGFDASAGVLEIPVNAKYARLSAQTAQTPTLSLCRVGLRGAAAEAVLDRAPAWRGGIQGANYSRAFANAAGAANLITLLQASEWDDIPYGGPALNAQYTGGYDLQMIWRIDGRGMAYRFVDRSTHAPYCDWRDTAATRLKGKKLAIIGDSRSTYQGTMPSGNPSYYPRSSGSVITSQSQMWWQRLIDHFGMTLTVNDSYSGGFVASYSGDDAPASAAGILSSDTAISNLGSTAPDVIIVFAGVNDWNYNHVGIGEYDGTGSFPASNATFREAYAMMLSKVQQKFPAADIWLCTNPYCAPAGAAAPISNMPVPRAGNGGTSLDAFNAAIRDMARIFGCGLIDFTRCGVNWGNLKTYATDYDTDRGLHYNAAGNALLYNVARDALAAWYGEEA